MNTEQHDQPVTSDQPADDAAVCAASAAMIAQNREIYEELAK